MATRSHAPSPWLAPPSKNGKLSPRLSALASEGRFAAGRVEAATLSVPASGTGSLELRSHGRVLVEIRMSDTSTGAVAALHALGAEIVNVTAQYSTVTAWVATSALSPRRARCRRALRQRSARPAGRRRRRFPGSGERRAGQRHTARGRCVTGGVRADRVGGRQLMNVATARRANNIDGSGETVGILSDSFDTNSSEPRPTKRMTSPPASSRAGQSVRLHVAGRPCRRTPRRRRDEGRAMAQLVHGLAPGAHLAFATTNNGELDFASEITKLRTVNHANVIVDDVTYLDEPFFQNGPIANAGERRQHGGRAVLLGGRELERDRGW